MRSRALVRLALVCAVVAGWIQFFPPERTDATLGGNWTLQVRALGCPRGYSGFDFAADCTEPAPGVAFRIRSEKANDWVNFSSDEDGAAVADVTGPGVPHLAMVSDSPGFAQIYASCTRQNGDTIEHDYDGFLTIGPVGQDGVVTCGWYFVPWEPKDALLTLRAFNCPDGMTAETLNADECTATTTGFDIGIGSTQGPMEPYTLADATLEGTAYTWNLGPAPPPVAGGRMEFGWYSIGETVLPPGYQSHLIIGDAIRRYQWGRYQIDVSGENWHAELEVYNFTTPPPLEEWSLTVRSFRCPVAYPDEQWSDDCVIPLSGVAFTTRVMARDDSPQPFPTDSSGAITLQQTYATFGNALTATVPEGYERFSVACAGTRARLCASGSDGPAAYLTDLLPGDDVICDWFFVPFADEEPTAAPTEMGPTAEPTQAVPTIEPSEAPIESLTPTATAVEGMPAHIHHGTCGRLRREPHHDLTDLTTTEGKWIGSRQTTIAEMSMTVIDASIEELTATRWAINVHGDKETNGGYLVCGEIGGVPNADGSLAIGLREVNGSGYTGTAYLAPGIRPIPSGRRSGFSSRRSWPRRSV